jgi:hypothetical protein
VYGIGGPEGMKARQLAGRLGQDLVELHDLQLKPPVIEIPDCRRFTPRLQSPVAPGARKSGAALDVGDPRRGHDRGPGQQIENYVTMFLQDECLYEGTRIDVGFQRRSSAM